MRIFLHPLNIWFFLVGALLISFTGCSTPDTAAERRQMLQILEFEMQSNTDWMRIHAADALINHGASNQVANFITPRSADETNPYRVGIWRVLSRCARTANESDHFRRQLRRIMFDPRANDRLQAAESLARLGVVLDDKECREIKRWLAEADEATAAYPLWLLILASGTSDRGGNEDRLAQLLESTDFRGRARAAFALGRLHFISDQSLLRLNRRLKVEPAESPARVYIITALLLHAKKNSSAAESLKHELSFYLAHGAAEEQAEAAIVTGMCGTAADLKALAPLLTAANSDARIGAANGSLYILR